MENRAPRATEKPSLQRKLFTVEEDHMLRILVCQYGPKDFKKIASFMPGRTPRQARERYRNYLAPEINNGPWTRDEDELLRAKYGELGPKWSKIADFFPTRSDINVKNRWTSICGRNPMPVSECALPGPLPVPSFSLMAPYEREEGRGILDDGIDSFHVDPFSSGYVASADMCEWFSW